MWCQVRVNPHLSLMFMSIKENKFGNLSGMIQA